MADDSLLMDSSLELTNLLQNDMNSFLMHMMAASQPLQSLSTGLDTVSDEAKLCSSSSENSQSPSISPNQDESALDALKRLHAASPSTTFSAMRDSYFECFQTRNPKELDALVYSLFVTRKKADQRDGYEHYECLSRTGMKKCRYRLRTKNLNGLYIVEEKGCHSHNFDPSAFNSQGLPRTIREIVDRSFGEDWPATLRTQKVQEEVLRLGLPPNPKLNRQIDNRLSYLRRTKNIQDCKKLEIDMRTTGNNSGEHELNQALTAIASSMAASNTLTDSKLFSPQQTVSSPFTSSSQSPSPLASASNSLAPPMTSLTVAPPPMDAASAPCSSNSSSTSSGANPLEALASLIPGFPLGMSGEEQAALLQSLAQTLPGFGFQQAQATMQ